VIAHALLTNVALGADAVMVGRHIVRGAHGGGKQGVARGRSSAASKCERNDEIVRAEPTNP
jgi:hypothetical protein